MHAVVNQIQISETADWTKMTSLFRDFSAGTLDSHPEVISMQAVRASDTELILIILFRDAEAMAQFSSAVAGPWFAENIRPFMGGPADRKTGEVVFDHRG